MEQAALLAILSGLVAAGAWGTSDFFGAKASKTVGPITSAYYVNLIGLFAYVPVYVLFLRSPDATWGTGAAFAAASGLLLTLALFLLYRGMAYGPVSIVTPLSASYPLFTTIIAILVFGATLSAWQLLAILIIVIGVMAISGLFNLKKSERRLGPGAIFGLCSAVVYGLAFVLAAQGVERSGWQTVTLMQGLAANAALLLCMPLLQRKEPVLKTFKSSMTNKFIIGAALLGIFGLLALSIGFSHDQTSGAIAVAVSACYPVITITLALKHFKEDFKLVPMLGVAASIAGVIILTLAS